MSTTNGLAAEITALENSAGVRLRREVHSLEITGPDRVRFLNGMLTADVKKLAPLAGTLAVKTNAKGRIEAVVRARMAERSLWLESIDPVSGPLRASLEAFVIMDDVTISAADRDVVTVLGPLAQQVVGRVLDRTIDLAPHAFESAEDLVIISDRTLGVPGIELHVPVGQGPSWVPRLVSQGATAVSTEATDVVRVLAGWPIDGRDLDSEVFPMEVSALDEAISYSKGCYVGQEVVARAKNLGHVNYRLTGLELLDGFGSERSALVLEDEFLAQGESAKRVGETRSIVTVGDRQLGLAFVHRRVTDGSRVRVGRARASVVPLPFSR